MFFAKRYNSPNFDVRANAQYPSMIVLHYTGMKTEKGALERLCDSASKVSAHYLIDIKGKIRQLVQDENRAWHAGVSYWGGERDINSASLGIEIVNPGHEFGYQSFSERQIESLVFLCARLIKKYKIPPARILGHSDIAPSRKVDPGHLLPWERLARKSIGLWPEVEEMDLSAGAELVQCLDSFHALLCGYGYSPEASAEDVIVAFHRHFAPEKFKSWDDRPAVPDAMSCARMLA